MHAPPFYSIAEVALLNYFLPVAAAETSTASA